MRENSGAEVLTDEKPEVPRRLVYPSHEARRLLGDISIPTFRRLTKSGRLKSRKIGAYVYVEHDDLMAFINGLPSGASIEDGAAA